MRRAGARKTRSSHAGAGGVSLFPFLAVLICTMGSLIVLLIVFAQQAKLQADQAAAEAADATTDDVQQIRSEREVAQWEATALKESRVKTEAQLAEARLRLGGIEDHLRTLRDELARLDAALRELERTANDGSQDRGQLEAELARLRAEIALAEKQLAKELDAAQKNQNSYAIIPYDGPNQTHRRPVYIECRAEAVILQPEGIIFHEDDFADPIGPGNPLAAALRAIREFQADRQTPAADKADEPYPLLLVRPDGITAYYAARSAMDTWSSDFGYELIGQNWDLKFPAPDPELNQVVARAVATARKRQELLAEIAPREAGSLARSTYRAGARGIVRADSPGDDVDDLPLPARPGRAPFGGVGPGGEGPDSPGGNTGSPGGSAGTSGDGAASGAAGGSGDAVAYARRPEGRAFGSQFGDGGAATGGAAGGNGGQSGGDAAPSAAGQTATRRPENYVAGRPAEQDSSVAQGGRPLRPGEWEPSPPKSSAEPPREASPDSQANQVVRRHRPEQNLAKVRGKDWGLPDTTRDAIPITRPVRVDCYADHLVIAPEGKSGGRVVRFGPQTRDSVDAMVSAVWDHMDTWGIAGRGMYWRPVLSLRVAPGAEARYDDLKALLEGSGMRVEKMGKDEG